MESSSDVNAELNASKGVFRWVGILLIILGAVSILVPALASWAIVIFIAWILIIASVFLFASAFNHRDAGGMIVRMLWSLVTLIAGVILLVDPGKGTKTLTLILAIYFLVMGVVRIAVAFSERGRPGVGWLAVNGVLSLIIGIIIGIDYPNSADWAIGLLVGIDLMFGGWVLIMLSSSIKQLDPRT